MLLTLSSLFISLSLQAANPLTCQQGPVRVHEFGKIREFNLRYCSNKNFTVLTSPECQNGPERKCTALAYHPPIAFKEIYRPSGTPAFHLCRRLGGSPELLEIAVNKTWQPLDRCIFPNGSFVDGGTLVQHHIHQKK
ncbi:hypothetical protein D3C72_2020620 [compost metagenome]